MFELKLCLALHKSLAQLYSSVDSTELTLWQGYHALYGLPHDRLEACVAMGAAANCQVQGSKISAADLIPKFTRPVTPAHERANRQVFRDWVDSHNQNQRQLTK